MKEMLTDELLEDMAIRYESFTKIMEENSITFEQFLDRQLRIRAWHLRRSGIHVEV